LSFILRKDLQISQIMWHYFINIGEYMPLPKPRKEERAKDFISRCMKNTVMLKEFPLSAQRFAVCMFQSKKRK